LASPGSPPGTGCFAIHWGDLIPDQGLGQIKRWILYHEEASINTDEATQLLMFLR